MSFALYFDEDAMDSRLVAALRGRKVNVVTAEEANTRAADDEVQLAFSTAQNRVLYTRNAKDFCRLHAEFLATGHEHGGIVVANDVLAKSVGAQLRKLRNLLALKSSSDLRNMLEYLSNY